MAKKVKIKLPKRVAGVKIPKVVRKGPVGQFLNSGAGQVLLAETLVAAAAMFATTKADEHSSVADDLRHPVDKARQLGHALADAGTGQSERLAHAFKAASRAFHEALQETDASAWEEVPAVAETKSKKKSSARTSHGTAH
jgi:hypothetical protein